MKALLVVVFVWNIFLSHSAPDQYYALDPETKDDVVKDSNESTQLGSDITNRKNDGGTDSWIHPNPKSPTKSLSERTGHYIYRGQSPKPVLIKPGVERKKLNNERSSYEESGQKTIDSERTIAVSHSFDGEEIQSQTFADFTTDSYNINKETEEHAWKDHEDSDSGSSGGNNDERRTWSVTSNGSTESSGDQRVNSQSWNSDSNNRPHNLKNQRAESHTWSSKGQLVDAFHNATENPTSYNRHGPWSYKSYRQNNTHKPSTFRDRDDYHRTWRYPDDDNDHTRQYSWSDNTSVGNTGSHHRNRKYSHGIKASDSHYNVDVADDQVNHNRKVSDPWNDRVSASTPQENREVEDESWDYASEGHRRFSEDQESSWMPISPPSTQFNRDYKQYLHSKKRRPSSSHQSSSHSGFSSFVRPDDETYVPILRNTTKAHNVPSHTTKHISLHSTNNNTTLSSVNPKLVKSKDHSSVTNKPSFNNEYTASYANPAENHQKNFQSNASDISNATKVSKQSTGQNLHFGNAANSTKRIKLHTRGNSSRNRTAQSSIVLKNSTAVPYAISQTKSSNGQEYTNNAEYFSSNTQDRNAEFSNTDVDSANKDLGSVTGLSTSSSTNENRKSPRLFDYNNRYRFLRNWNHRLISNDLKQDGNNLQNNHIYIVTGDYKNCESNDRTRDRVNKSDALKKLLLEKDRSTVHPAAKLIMEPNNSKEEELKKANAYVFMRFRKQNQTNALPRLKNEEIYIDGLKINKEIVNNPTQEPLDAVHADEKVREPDFEPRNETLINDKPDSNRQNATTINVGESKTKLYQEESRKLLEHEVNESIKSRYVDIKNRSRKDNSTVELNRSQNASIFDENVHPEAHKDNTTATVHPQAVTIASYNVTKLKNVIKNRTKNYSKELSTNNDFTDITTPSGNTFQNKTTKINESNTDISNKTTSNTEINKKDIEVTKSKQSDKTENASSKNETVGFNDESTMNNEEVSHSIDTTSETSKGAEIKEEPTKEEKGKDETDKETSPNKNIKDKSDKKEKTPQKFKKNESKKDMLDYDRSNDEKSSTEGIKKEISDEVKPTGETKEQQPALYKSANESVNNQTSKNSSNTETSEKNNSEKDQPPKENIKIDESANKNNVLKDKKTTKDESSTIANKKEPTETVKDDSNKNTTDNKEATEIDIIKEENTGKNETVRETIDKDESIKEEKDKVEATQNKSAEEDTQETVNNKSTNEKPKKDKQKQTSTAKDVTVEVSKETTDTKMHSKESSPKTHDKDVSGAKTTEINGPQDKQPKRDKSNERNTSEDRSIQEDSSQEDDSNEDSEE